MEILNYLKANLDLVIVAIVFLSGFFTERILPWEHIRISNDKKYDTTLKTLFISMFIGAIYILLAHRESNTSIAWAKCFLSYFAATSLYELLIRPITKWIKAMSHKIPGADGKDDEDSATPPKPAA